MADPGPPDGQEPPIPTTEGPELLSARPDAPSFDLGLIAQLALGRSRTLEDDPDDVPDERDLRLLAEHRERAAPILGDRPLVEPLSLFDPADWEPIESLRRRYPVEAMSYLFVGWHVSEEASRKAFEVSGLEAASREKQASVVVSLLYHHDYRDPWWATTACVIRELVKVRLPFTGDDVNLLLALASRANHSWAGASNGMELIVAAIEALPPTAGSNPRLARRIRSTIEDLYEGRGTSADARQLQQRLWIVLRRLTGEHPRSRTANVSVIAQDDGFGPEARRLLEDPDLVLDGVADLLEACGETPDGPHPPKDWRTRTEGCVRSCPAATELVERLLDAAARSPRVGTVYAYNFARPARVGEANVHLVRGLMWAAASCGGDWVAPRIGDVARDTLRNGAPTIANTSFAVLGSLPRSDSAGVLVDLRRRTKSRPQLRQIDAALARIAGATGTSVTALLETAVPDPGLGDDGATTVAVGEHTATLALTAAGEASLTWAESGGRTSARVPPGLQRSHPDEVKAVKARFGELRDMVGAERSRLEQLTMTRGSWAVPEWTAAYLRPPVTGRLARKLLWRVRTSSGPELVGLPVEDDSRIQLADGSELPIDAEASVSPWHPMHSDVETISSWRDFLVSAEIVQPFKQVFREVYLVTMAEEATGTYSNRFAGHVLRHRQAYALMRARGWSATLFGPWDGNDRGEAQRDFPDQGLRAIFCYAPVWDDAASGPEPANCSTDRVTFVALGANGRPVSPRASLPLAAVDPLVFSEAMRDVDLFVSVTSIATDPTWVDRGVDPDYWESSFEAPLTETGASRRDALLRLLPKLAIASQCRLGDRHLEVAGRLRRYRIHLGSAGVLVLPENRHVCIMANPAKTPGAYAYLPFEGDGTLSLILSKAFLLADDDKITDASILSQLN